jgi:hypothetical protein
MVSECLFGKIPSDWDQSPELGGAGAGGWWFLAHLQL